MSVHETPAEASSDTLVEPVQLRAHLSDPAWIVIDCRFDLARPEAGREAYRRSHIPNARYAHLDEDLSSPVTAATGRHPLPDAQKLATQLSRRGVTPSTQVVAYDDANSAFASRMWWLLRWLGHRKVAVLNGGFKAWEAGGFPVDAQVPPTAATSSAPPRKPQPGVWLTTDEVRRGLADRSILLVDARTADRFAGQNETIDPVAGHIPGAINHPFPSNLDSSQRFLPAERLRSNWTQTLGAAPASKAVLMCGSGVTACHNVLALEIAGLKGARLYAGSWSEWIRDPARPVTTGS